MMSHHEHFHSHKYGERDDCSQPHHHAHLHKDNCSTSERDCYEPYHKSHGRGCCDSAVLVRRYISPKERKETLEKYIEDLKKELAGAEHELQKL